MFRLEDALQRDTYETKMRGTLMNALFSENCVL